MVYRIYYPLSVELALSQGTSNTIPVPWPLYATIHNTNSPTESDLGWPTLYKSSSPRDLVKTSKFDGVKVMGFGCWV